MDCRRHAQIHEKEWYGTMLYSRFSLLLDLHIHRRHMSGSYSAIGCTRIRGVMMSVSVIPSWGQSRQRSF